MADPDHNLRVAGLQLDAQVVCPVTCCLQLFPDIIVFCAIEHVEHVHLVSLKLLDSRLVAQSMHFEG